MKVKSVVWIWMLAIGLSLASCSSGRIPCPDVSGKKGFSFFGLFKKNEMTPEDQANEGRDYGGQDMSYNKQGLLKKKKVKLPTQKKTGYLFAETENKMKHINRILLYTLAVGTLCLLVLPVRAQTVYTTAAQQKKEARKSLQESKYEESDHLQTHLQIKPSNLKRGKALKGSKKRLRKIDRMPIGEDGTALIQPKSKTKRKSTFLWTKKKTRPKA